MKIALDYNDYWQGVDRPVIQIKTELRWIVWNWNKNTWDTRYNKLNEHGEPKC